jgi:NAD(P)H-dependent FMN reductase
MENIFDPISGKYQVVQVGTKRRESFKEELTKKMKREIEIQKIVAIEKDLYYIEHIPVSEELRLQIREFRKKFNVFKLHRFQ